MTEPVRKYSRPGIWRVLGRPNSELVVWKQRTPWGTRWYANSGSEPFDCHYPSAKHAIRAACAMSQLK